MGVPHSLLYLSQARAAAALMGAMARGDECVSLLCEPGISTAAVLDEAENELSSHRLRCVRVYGPASGGLTLRDLVAQIVARADPDAITDADLKAGFVTLTEPGEGYDRVALLVTEAHNLLPSAMRYIQLACRCSPKLRIALAGQPGLAAVLAQNEFAFLRGRIARTLQLPGPAPGGASKLSSVLAGLRRVAAGPLVRSGGMVAASALLIAAAGWHLGPAPSEATMRADVAGLGEVAAPIRAEPAASADAPSLAKPALASVPAPKQADAPAGPDPALPAQPAGSDAPPAAPPERAAEALPDTALPLRAFAAALPSLDVLQARRLHGGTERAAATAPAPTRSAEERHCRDIVLQTQSGRDLSDADQTFLRGGCRAK